MSGPRARERLHGSAFKKLESSLQTTTHLNGGIADACGCAAGGRESAESGVSGRGDVFAEAGSGRI